MHREHEHHAESSAKHVLIVSVACQGANICFRNHMLLSN